MLRFALLWLGVFVGMAYGQLNLSIKMDRSEFILFEPVLVKVVVGNASPQEIHFNSKEGQSWLGFRVRGAKGAFIFPDQKFESESLTLKPGENKSFEVNVTPYYDIRETGAYEVQVTVAQGERHVVSNWSRFTVGKGQVIWSKSVPVNGVMRAFTLIRFAISTTTTYLYVQVEEIEKNIVYACYPIGAITMHADPEKYFDSDGSLHLLFPKGGGSYCYSRIDVGGNQVHQATYASTVLGKPKLTKGEDGSVLVMGGQMEKKGEQRKSLSRGQKYLPEAPKGDKELDFRSAPIKRN